MFTAFLVAQSVYDWRRRQHISVFFSFFQRKKIRVIQFFFVYICVCVSVFTCKNLQIFAHSLPVSPCAPREREGEKEKFRMLPSWIIWVEIISIVPRQFLLGFTFTWYASISLKILDATLFTHVFACFPNIFWALFFVAPRFFSRRLAVC